MSVIGYGRGRKPIHIQGLNTGGYAAVWSAIRELRQFTSIDVSMWMVRNKISGANQGTIDSYIQRLLKANFIIVMSKKHYRGKTYLRTYELVKDIGIQAPKLDKKGCISKQGNGQRNLWRTMKILKVFTYRELAAAATTGDVTVSPNSAHSYINALAKSGYVMKVEQHKHTGIPARFRFIPSKDTGPLPPQIQRTKAVFDPNINEVVWTPNKQEEVA